jgi:hypothetical protein
LFKVLSHPTNYDDRQSCVYLYVIAGGFFVLDMYAMSWLSMRLGLTGRKPVRIIMLSFWWAVLLPGVVSLGSSYAYLLTSVWNLKPYVIALLWAIPSLVSDLIVIAVGRYHILNRFREGFLERAGTFPPAPPAR